MKTPMLKLRGKSSSHVLTVLVSTAVLFAVIYLAIPSELLQLFLPTVRAANYTVTNTNASGPGSLAGVIAEGQLDDSPDTISFNIPPTDPRHFYYRDNGIAGSVDGTMKSSTTAADDTQISDIDPDWPHSWYSIETVTVIDMFTSPVRIDGYTQPGAVINTNTAGGLNSVLKIEVTNSLDNCLRIFRNYAVAVTYRGLVINRCSRSTAARLIDFEVSSDGSRAEGNYIGTDPSGTIGMGSGFGAIISRSNNVLVGDGSAAHRNLISGNHRGVNMNNANFSNLVFSNIWVINNLLGTRRDGVSALASASFPGQLSFTQDGVQISAVNGLTFGNRIENNIVAFNARYGILLDGGGVGTTNTVIDNRILGNSIHSNGNIGINIAGGESAGGNSVTVNDPCDMDIGLNGQQNYPTIKDATITGSNVAISGTLNSAQGGTFRLEFFASDANDSTYFGEGKTFLGARTIVLSPDSCNGAFDVSLPLPNDAGNFITATATDLNGNTSEFSAVYIAQSQNASCTLRPDGLAAWYSAQGNVNDSQAEHHGKFQMPPQYTAGKVGHAFNLTARSNADVIEVPDNPNLDFTNAFTIEMWISPGEVGLNTGQKFFISKGDFNTVGTQSYGIFFLPDRRIVHRIGNSSTLDQLVSTASIPLNEFTHIATTYDGTTLRVYINGVLDSSRATSIGTLLNTSGPLVIGGSYFGTTPFSTKAVIDEPSLYDRALSGSEISSIFGSGSSGKCKVAPQPNSCGLINGDLTVVGSSDVNIDLSCITGVTGSINVSGNTGAGSIDLSNVTTVGSAVDVSDNAAGSVNLGSLQTVGGSVDVSDNTAAASIDLGSLQTVGGSVDVSDNTAAGSIDLGSLQAVTGDVAVSGNTSATSIDLGALQAVEGDVAVSGNTSATGIDLGAMNSVGGNISIGNNTSASSIDLGGVATVPGDVSIASNTAASTIDLAGLQTVDGSISIADNTAAPSIDLSGLDTVSGGVDINGNSAATTIDLGDLATAGGSVDINGNNAAATIDLSGLESVGEGQPGVTGDLKVIENKDCTKVILGSLTSVERNLSIDSCATGAFTIGNASVGGDARLNLANYSSVNGLTAAGSTAITNLEGAATMTVTLPPGTFNSPVTFQVTRLEPAVLLPEPGTTPDGQAVIDPVMAYQFTFGVPTLNQNAALAFDVRLDRLDPVTRTSLLQALSTGRVTLATKGDAPGSAYQSFRLCAAGEIPSAGGCVELQILDSNGEPTGGTPAILRFRNVVGSFSRWGVAIVVPDGPNNIFHGLLHPYPEQSAGIVPTIKRGSTFPIKFNWRDDAGAVINSGLANPAVSIFPVNCESQQGTTSQIVVEDSGSSGGLRYDATSNTWIFNWSTRQVSAGCYSIRIATANSQFAGPGRSFPISLHR